MYHGESVRDEPDDVGWGDGRSLPRPGNKNIIQKDEEIYNIWMMRTWGISGIIGWAREREYQVGALLPLIIGGASGRTPGSLS